MYRHTRFFIVSRLVVSLSTALLAAEAMADTSWSPPVRIVVLQVGGEPGVLRIGVRRRLEVGADPFDFNPANCSSPTAAFVVGGVNTATQIFDLEFGQKIRSATEQRLMFNAVYAAFATGRVIELQVSNDGCTATGFRITTGLKIVY